MTALVALPLEEVLRGLDPAKVEQAPCGTVYLLHLNVPYKAWSSDYTWSHYIGWASQGNLEARLAAHWRGSGARFTAKARRQGCTWHLARVWEGSPKLERKIKNQGGASRFCPSCGIVPLADRQLIRNALGQYATPELRKP